MGKRDELHAKHERLRQIVKDTGGMVVAFSGGVDSTYLLKVASDVLGPGVLAVSAMAAAFPRRELDEAEQFCAVQGVGQVVFPFCELAVQGFCDNPPDRCYLCKKALFSEIWAVARSHGFSVVADGSNLDDEGDYRPGMRALAGSGCARPLREVAGTKADIRELSRELGLPTWSKPLFRLPGHVNPLWGADYRRTSFHGRQGGAVPYRPRFHPGARAPSWGDIGAHRGAARGFWAGGLPA